jgi:hypothetical protein
MAGKWIWIGLVMLISTMAWSLLSVDLVSSASTVSPDVVQSRSLAQDTEQKPALSQLAIEPGPVVSSIESDKPSGIQGGFLQNSPDEPVIGFIQAIKTTRALAPPVPSMLLSPSVEPRTLSEAIEMARTAQEKAPEYLGSAAMNPFASIPK